MTIPPEILQQMSTGRCGKPAPRPTPTPTPSPDDVPFPCGRG
jgi:hypothetical protein